MLCGLGVQAGMARVLWQVKMCDSSYNSVIPERFRAVYDRALYKSAYTSLCDWNCRTDPMKQSMAAISHVIAPVSKETLVTTDC